MSPIAHEETGVAEVIVLLVCLFLITIVFVEWFGGCGESYLDAQGARHNYECVLLD
jgi:hypothetical protein